MIPAEPEITPSASNLDLTFESKLVIESAFTCAELEIVPVGNKAAT
jgi:hypothetical protein